MIEGFFLDGVNGKGSNKSVKGEVRLSVPVKPDPALAASARFKLTMPGTEIALYAILLRREKPGLYHGFFLPDVRCFENRSFMAFRASIK